VLDHVYRAVTWQRVDQIHYSIFMTNKSLHCQLNDNKLNHLTKIGMGFPLWCVYYMHNEFHWNCFPSFNMSNLSYKLLNQEEWEKRLHTFPQHYSFHIWFQAKTVYLFKSYSLESWFRVNLLWGKQCCRCGN
jgi:hypothetical protein